MSREISERDEMTLRVLALLDRTTFAEQRREAVRAYARQARQDEDVAGIVRLMLASRRQRAGAAANVIFLAGRLTGGDQP